MRRLPSASLGHRPAWVAQLVEQRIRNAQVRGSSPLPGSEERPGQSPFSSPAVKVLGAGVPLPCPLALARASSMRHVSSSSTTGIRCP